MSMEVFLDVGDITVCMSGYWHMLCVSPALCDCICCRLICISYMLQASTPHFKHAVNFCIAHPANCRLLFMHSAKETVAFHASDVPQGKQAEVVVLQNWVLI